MCQSHVKYTRSLFWTVTLVSRAYPYSISIALSYHNSYACVQNVAKTYGSHSHCLPLSEFSCLLSKCFEFPFQELTHIRFPLFSPIGMHNWNVYAFVQIVANPYHLSFLVSSDYGLDTCALHKACVFGLFCLFSYMSDAFCISSEKLCSTKLQ